MQNLICQAQIGHPGSGLTTHAIDTYSRLIKEGISSTQILFIVRSSSHGEHIRRQVHERFPALVGPLSILSFSSLAIRMVSRYWDQILGAVEDIASCFQPELLTKDLSQHLVMKVCSLCPDHESNFGELGLAPYIIYDQIDSVNYIAGASGYPPEEAAQRLARAWGDAEPETRLRALEHLGCCMKRLRREALQEGCLDMGQTLQLFQQHVLPLSAFWSSFDHLVVDQAEELPSLGLELLSGAHRREKGIHLTYTIGGGYSLPAVSDGVAHWIFKNAHYQYQAQPLKGSLAMAWLGQRVAQILSPSFRNPLPLPVPALLPSVTVLEAQTPTEGATVAHSQIQALIAEGVPAEQIAIILPRADATFTLALETLLETGVEPLEQFPSLVRYPLVRALLTAIELAHPDWGLFPTVTQTANFLGVVLNLDAVRAALIARDVCDPVSKTLRDSFQVQAPERVGFAALGRYRTLLEWLSAYRQGKPMSLDYFLRHFFAQRLSTVILEQDDQQLIQSLIDAASRFRLAFPHYPEREFMQMIRSGQTPTRYRNTNLDERKSPVIATPDGYIAQGLSSTYQIWIGINALSWFRPSWRALFNHEVLTPQWDGMPFGPTEDTQAQRHALGKRLFNLCCRLDKGLYLVRIAYDNRGQENQGMLEQVILHSLKPNP